MTKHQVEPRCLLSYERSVAVRVVSGSLLCSCGGTSTCHSAMATSSSVPTGMAVLTSFVAVVRCCYQVPHLCYPESLYPNLPAYQPIHTFNYPYRRRDLVFQKLTSVPYLEAYHDTLPATAFFSVGRSISVFIR